MAELGGKVPDLQFVGLLNQGQKFVSPNLRIGASIYPNNLDSNLFVPSRGSGARHIDWDERRSEASIVKFNWDKQLGLPSGKWSMTVKIKRDHATGDPLLNFNGQEIVDGDWIDLFILRNNVKIPLCRGFIDSVREQTKSSLGATSVVYVLTGRDHGAFFEYPITWTSLWAQTINELSSGLMTRRLDGFVGGRPDEIFRALIKGTFQGGKHKSKNPSGQWEIPKSLAEISHHGFLYDLLKVITFAADKGGKHLRGAYYNEPSLWSTGTQTLHRTLSQWVNPLLNEFWYDLIPPKAFMPKHGLAAFLGSESYQAVAAGVGPMGPENEVRIQIPQEYESDNKDFGQIAAIIRERPFPTTTAKLDSMWFSLPTWTIPTWLVLKADLGRSGHQRYNVFELLVDFGFGSQQEQSSFAMPSWSRKDITTHGLRKLPGSTTRFADDSPDDKVDWNKERAIWLSQLVDWNAPNPYLLQGRIELKVPLPEIRCGHRVIIDNGDPKQQIQAYVEGVSINVASPTQSAGVSGTTSLLLTRGFVGSDQELLRATIELAQTFESVF